MLTAAHHIAVACSDEAQALDFYVDKLGFQVTMQTRREAQGDTLRMLRKGDVVLELFIKPGAQKGSAAAGGLGLRHLCFRVDCVDDAIAWLKERGIGIDTVLQDPFTGGKIVFFHDPDGLALELHE